MVRRGLVLAGWFGGLVGVLVALHAVPLAAPDLTSPGTWSSWTAERTPPEAAMGVLRLVGIGLAWYLLAATVLGIVAHLVGGARSVELADVVTLPFVRRVVQVGLGVGFASAVVAAAGARGHVPLERTPTAADVALATDPVPFLEHQPPKRGVQYSENVVAGPRTWVIRPGEHLWSVAEMVLAESLGRRPHESETHPYWRVLVEANRHRLPVPSNPDLVHSGLEIEIPLPSAA